jgi:glycosyltransferase 2 family protein
MTLGVRSKRALRIGGQILLLVVIGWYVYQSLARGFEQSNFAVLRFDWRWLAVSWVLLAGYYATYTLGLDLIMRTLGSPSTYLKAFKLNFASNLGKYVPGGFWPALGRVALAPAMSLSRAHAAVSLVLEAGLSTAGGLIVFALSLAFGGMLPAGTQPWQWVVLAAVLVVCLHPVIFRRALALVFRLARFGQSPPSLSYGATLGLVGLYSVSWVIAGLAFAAFARALVSDAGGGFMQYAGAYAAASIAGLVVLFAPGGIGVREGVLAVLITPLVGAGNAVIVSFAARVWSTLLELVLSGVALTMPSPGASTISVDAESPTGKADDTADD